VQVIKLDGANNVKWGDVQNERPRLQIFILEFHPR
jgi:hypothetical protein